MRVVRSRPRAHPERQELFRVVRCLPSGTVLSLRTDAAGQASDKPRGRKPRDRSAQGRLRGYGDLKDRARVGGGYQAGRKSADLGHLAGT